MAAQPAALVRGSTEARVGGVRARLCAGAMRGARLATQRLWPHTSRHAGVATWAVQSPNADGARKEKKQKKQGGSDQNQKNQRGAASTSSSASFEELRAVRIQKADELRRIATSEGRATSWMPFAYRFERSHTASELHAKYADVPAGEDAEDGAAVSVCGRVMARRVFGKLAFVTIEDASGRIQLQVSKANLPSAPDGDASEGDAPVAGLAFAEMKKTLDMGDIVGATGTLRRTDKGELSVNCVRLDVLTKALRPLPDKWHGLGKGEGANVEARYRQREVDLIVSGRDGLARRAIIARSAALGAMRARLDGLSYLEVETPVLHARAGGADARPFLTTHNALSKDLTLRIATELHLKRLIVGGLERVYEIGRVFRNEGTSTRHNPEFTSLELYQAYADYEDVMALTEELVREAARAALVRLSPALAGDATAQEDALGAMPYQGATLDLAKPFARVSMRDAVVKAAGVDPFEVAAAAGAEEGSALSQAISDRIAEAGVTRLDAAGAAQLEAACTAGPGHALGCLFDLFVEGTLIQPTFVTDLPLAMSPLAKPHRHEPEKYAERFEMFVCGRELANAFSELTDPIDQRRRFEGQIASHAAQRKALAAQAAAEGVGGEDAGEFDYDIELDEEFLSALEHGMPPTAGMGLGIDRLVMLLIDAPSIRDVISFPLLK